MVLAGIGLALGVLLALVFAESAGVKKKAEKALTWVGAGAVSLLLAEVSYGTTLANVAIGTGLTWVGDLFTVIGYILVLVGSILAVYTLVSAKK